MLSIKSGDTIYKFGTITSFSDSFSKSVSATPIVSLPTDCAFPLETSASLTYDVSFTRLSPQDYDDESDDSDMWCNATWVERVSSLINRWQMRSDGYEMTFQEDDGDETNPYVPNRVDRVYIKSLSFSCDPGYTDVVTGSMQMKVGTVRTLSNRPMPKSGSYDIPPESKIDLEDSYVMITSPNQRKLYLLQYGKVSKGKKDYDRSPTYSVDCLNSYTVTGGPSTPFENIQLKISRKRLTELYPELGESADSTFSTDILAGKSYVRFRGIGEGEMIVSNCKMTSDEYTITAYCRAEVYRAQTLNMTLNGTPMECITEILTGVSYGALYTKDRIVSFGTKNIENALIFTETTTCWQALQICAGVLNAKIFFANNKAYVINYSEAPNLYGEIELYPENTSDAMYGRVVGQATYGNEGQDTIINAQSVFCGKDESNNEIVKSVKDDPSIRTYSYIEGNRIDVSPFIKYTETMPDVLLNLCDHVVQYACEPQKSISFKVKEQSSEGASGAWAPVFPTCSCVSKLKSSVDGISISNETTSARTATQSKARPQKLYLSEYERQYPKMITEYTFGVISNVDLQNTLSKIQTR